MLPLYSRLISFALPLVCAIPALAALPDGKVSSSYLGEYVLWRPRESVVFHLQDPEGTGFALRLTLRDMNIYQQGDRPVMFWVTGPAGNTLVNRVIDDTPERPDNDQYRDGLSDMYQDCRYREWHRHNSANGYPPGKVRSRYLEHPEELEARDVNVRVPPAGKGLYRVMIQASWDHWVSLTPDRAIPAGVHPGPGPLYVHGNRLQDCFLYAPATTDEIGISLSEEILPFNWRVTVQDSDGKTLAETVPRSFLNFTVLRDAPRDSVLRLRIEGHTTGACLHIAGVPFVLCPDAETARLIHGGLNVDARGRPTFHHHQRVLLEWADSLKLQDLAADVVLPEANPLLSGKGKTGLSLHDIPGILACQDLDPASSTYGAFHAPDDPALATRFSHWRRMVDVVAAAAGLDDLNNPYLGHPALVRRVLLCRAMTNLQTLSPYFWYGHQEGPKTFTIEEDRFWGVPFRSAWYPMHDAMHVLSLRPIRDAVTWALPAEVFQAWRQSFLQWTTSRTLMHQGECSNQWAAGLKHMKQVWEATQERQVEDVLRRQVERFTTPGNLGRVAPDPTPYSLKSAIGYPHAADCGLIGGGIASDGLGHDNEYCLESTLHMAKIWEALRSDSIRRWLDEYYVLKTHLTLPKWGVHTATAFTETCSPSDSNFRTRYYTHKSPLGKLRPHIRYGPLWVGEERDDAPWPCLEEETFLRNIDNRFYFIKTPAYYSIVYAGPSRPDWGSWGAAVVKNGSAELAGHTGMHYGGLQYKPTKAGAISAVWVKDCGPTLLCQNHNVMFSNVVWGRVREPLFPKWEDGHVDPTIVCSAYAQPETSFDEATRTYRKREDMPSLPLTVERTISFQDETIRMSLVLTATDDVNAVELYECIPYFAEKRRIRALTGTPRRFAEFAIPSPITTPSKWPRGKRPDPLLSGENAELPKVTAQGFAIAADSGAGSVILFDKEQTFTQTQPIRYRKVAAATGAWNLPVPTRMAKGQTHTVRYRIYSHQEPLDTETLNRLIEEPR
ncbi:MAG: hypothetical protein HN742_16215 [Lentisphaerae bacterium]|jgi:hypothetical protein|nr:hypothetical protein [Lentisphaerota bacterium]MBT4817391.1 hypothetical protein [Lentisphaerota bacterium]MBT5612167.1 hypothetical protein [Lentisphaerota bacterium]MBT7061094.1 hypothetical protein [Lentisphaerota bacterium]MBT7843423.1 hypothetical protein [Lentisphaerota bacterium]